MVHGRARVTEERTEEKEEEKEQMRNISGVNGHQDTKRKAEQQVYVKKLSAH